MINFNGQQITNFRCLSAKIANTQCRSTSLISNNFSSKGLIQSKKNLAKILLNSVSPNKFVPGLTPINQTIKREQPNKPTKFNKVNAYATPSSRQPISGKRGTPMRTKGTNMGLKIKRVLSLSQILGRIRQQRQKTLEQQKRQKPIKPIIPPKSLIIILRDKPEKAVYNRRIIDYKHCGLLQRYIGLGGKILPRRQTRLTAKQQRYVAKTIKSARIMGLLPFVSKERGLFR